jgi:quercetin dioxygenase-like cupin family protein
MRPYRLGAVLVSCLFIAGVCLAAASSDSPNRKELKRADLSGAPGMEVISSIVEIKKGEQTARHFHHGVEAGYVLQGSMVQYPGKDPVMLETGTAILNLRDAVHGGFTVVGDQPVRIFTVHTVDKDKPLYDYVK